MEDSSAGKNAPFFSAKKAPKRYQPAPFFMAN
jgi:hypothetical protein